MIEFKNFPVIIGEAKIEKTAQVDIIDVIDRAYLKTVVDYGEPDFMRMLNYYRYFVDETGAELFYTDGYICSHYEVTREDFLETMLVIHKYDFIDYEGDTIYNNLSLIPEMEG